MNKSLIILVFTFFFSVNLFGQSNWEKYQDNPVLVPDQDWETRVIAPNAVIFENNQYHMWYTAGEFPALGGDLFIGHAVSADGLSWTKDEGNPVFANGDEGTWDSKGVYKPAVLKIGSTYHMWYNGYSSSNQLKGIGHATSDDGINWTRDAANPVLTAGTSDEWDYSRLANPTVVYDGSMYHMWYGGYNGDGSTIQLGHATSPDGTTWAKDRQNPVMSSEVGNWDSPQLDYPFAIYDGATFHIWYNAGDFLGWDLGYATSADGTNWTKYNNAVLTKGEAGAWDSRYLSMPVVLYDEALPNYKMWYRSESIANTNGGIGFAESSIKYPNPVMEPDQDWETRVIAPNAVIFENNQYHMWYTAGEFPALGGDLFIGHAVSADGLSWTKDEGNPVFVNGDAETWDSKGVYKPAVLKIGSTYHIWYNGYSSSNQLKGIGHATSDDGINWTRDAANPVLTAGTSDEWDYSRLANPTVVYDGSMYHMWYGGYNGDGSTIQLGHATSPDGTTWAKDRQNPVMSSEVGNWDSPQLDYPFAIYDGATFHIWYNAGDFLGWDLGYATSADGTNWTKYNNAVLTKGEAGAWDSRYLSMPVVLYDEAVQKYKMWFRGESAENTKGGIGFAEWNNLPSITAIEESPEINIPAEISLLQNYPNPFNPTTTIEFSLKYSGFVTIKVYNNLGKEVATVLNAQKPAGSHTVRFDASDLATGLYYYTLNAGDFKQTRKMLLIR